MSQTSPLSLDNLLFTEVAITAQQATQARIENASFETFTQFRTQQDPNDKRVWTVLLKVQVRDTGEGNTPYTGKIECVGRFTVVPTWPEEKLEQLVAINGTGILYSSVREMVCNITARGPWGMLILPSQSFLGAYEATQKAEHRAKAQAIPAV